MVAFYKEMVADYTHRTRRGGRVGRGGTRSSTTLLQVDIARTPWYSPILRGTWAASQVRYTMNRFDQSHVEWRAWRQVCKQLAKSNVDVNSNDPLACAIRMWGEELVALRREEPEHHASALREHREAYEPHWIEPRDE